MPSFGSQSLNQSGQPCSGWMAGTTRRPVPQLPNENGATEPRQTAHVVIPYCQPCCFFSSLFSVVPAIHAALEMLFLTACAVFLSIHSSQSAKTAWQMGRDLLLVCQALADGEGSPVCCQIWVTRQMGRSDSHFHLILGLPYNIAINICTMMAPKRIINLDWPWI